MSPRQFAARYDDGPYTDMSPSSKRGGLPPLPTKEEIDSVELSREDYRDLITNLDVVRAYMSKGIPHVRALAIKEISCKVRVASLHYACEVATARAIVKLWLPIIAHFGPCRGMLNGEIPKVSRDVTEAMVDKVMLLSAGLSAATDNILHQEAQTVGRFLNRLIDLPELDTITDKLLGPHMIDDTDPNCSNYDEKITKRGLHMGLGPS